MTEKDEEGNVYFCGTVRQPSNANGILLTTYGAYDIIVGKLNCHGDLVWVKPPEVFLRTLLIVFIKINLRKVQTTI